MLDRKFHGRDVLKRPTCPFCGLLVAPPKELTTRRQGEMPVGSCSCGAVYACDESGRNIGSAQIEALVFSCDMDWDLAWSLLPEEDYKQELVENYDFQNHLVVPGGFYESRRIAGVLLFVRLHEDVLEVTAEGVRKRLERALPASEAEKKKPAQKKTKGPVVNKKDVEKYIRDYRMEPLVEAAPTDRKLIRTLQRLIYSGDDQLRRRAAEAMGRVGAVVGETDPGSVSKVLQGLFYAISDTAASSWGAFEAIGEILKAKPELYAGYIPQLFQFLGDENRRAPTIEALATVAESRPDLLRKYTYHFQAFLSDPDPQVRGQTARLLGNLAAVEMRDDLEKLAGDAHELRLYRDGEMRSLTIGRLVEEILEKM